MNTQDQTRRDALLRSAKMVVEKAQAENRGLSTAEQDQVDSALNEVRGLNASAKAADLAAADSASKKILGERSTPWPADATSTATTRNAWCSVSRWRRLRAIASCRPTVTVRRRSAPAAPYSCRSPSAGANKSSGVGRRFSADQRLADVGRRQRHAIFTGHLAAQVIHPLRQRCHPIAAGQLRQLSANTLHFEASVNYSSGLSVGGGYALRLDLLQHPALRLCVGCCRCAEPVHKCE